MKKKINLIFFHPYSLIGGADTSLMRLIKNLDQRKYDIIFLSIKKSILKDKIKNIKFINLDCSRTLFSFFKFRNIVKRSLSSNNFEKIILISNQNFANIFAFISTLGLNNLKRIFVERNHPDELFFLKSPKYLIKNLIIYFLIKITYPFANKVITNSKLLTKSLKNITPKSKIATIYNPSFDKKIYELAKKKIQFKFKKNNKYIINVSRFTKRKGLEDLVISFYKCQKILKNLKLILIGYGEREENIKNLISNLKLKKKVYLIKNCSNPHPYIKRSNLFVFNSKYEGFPNVLVESIMLNTPVISTNCNSGPSEILLNNKGGDLIKVNNNIDIIKYKIINYFNNISMLHKKNNFAKKNLTRFTVKKNVKNYENLFSKI